MALITVISTGDGTAWVDNPNPAPNDTVTLTCQPFAGGATLEDIEARDGGGYSVALAVVPVQTFTWAYDTLTITVTFSTPKVNITIDGDGSAYVDTDYPTAGQTVTLTVTPDTNGKIKSIIGYDENGNMITFRNAKVQTFTWNYQSLDIFVTFKNKASHRMPIWEYPLFRN